VNDLFARLKRLFEPRPAENIGEPTADRPPPAAPEPAPPEPAPVEAPRVEAAAPPLAPPPAVEAAAPPPLEPPPVEVAPSREPASLHEEDLAEVKAALEAVAEDPVTVEAAETAEPEAELSPSVPETPPTEETVDVPAPVPAPVGDALILTLGTPPTTFAVPKTSATLGRGQENTIRLDDLSVSRRHARIAYRQGGYWLSDLGSMGGTWVNGTRLNAPRRIAAGEVIDIGLCRLTVSFGGGVAKAEAKKSASPAARRR
jgi:hypothetical protein